jgi:tripartite-type tricarboxylate transporter receptor subunit TctC
MRAMMRAARPGAMTGALQVALSAVLSAVLLPASASIVAGAAGAPAHERYPVRPVRVIVPAPPGGNADLVARPIADRMAELLKQPFAVENRPGAAGALGVQRAVRAAPDGHTLLVGELAQIAPLDPASRRAAGDSARDPARELVAVAKLAETPHALFAHPSLPVTNVRELVALARSQAGRIIYAGGERGSFADAVIESFNSSADIRLVRAPRLAGARPADRLLASEAMVGFDALHGRMVELRHKRLRALAVGTVHRVDAAPWVPTFAEAGFGEFLASPWVGLFAPSGTSHEVVAMLDAAATAALARREVRLLLSNAGLEPARTPRAQFGHQVRDDLVRFERVRAQWRESD